MCSPTARSSAAPRRLAHGFAIAQLVELVRAGLTTATPQRVKAGREQMEIAVLRITEAGRRALRGL